MLVESIKQFFPVLILLFAVWVVLSRLPKVELGHSKAFQNRRLLNWLPLGLTYAFLYMARYNLTVSKNAFGDLMTNADFGTIFGVGTIVYGFAFVINGPLTDKMGGRKAILIAAVGSALANFGMGVLTYLGHTSNLVLSFSILYGLNMYFQSFGAVAIVKVNASWFHLRERGTFGGIFGILISLGLYFAYDWGAMITKNFSLPMVFFIPTLILIVFFMISYATVRDTPSEAGFEDFDTADVSHEKEGEKLGIVHIAKRMFSHKVIVIISLIEFCSGFLRHAIMNEYLIFSKQTGVIENIVAKNWGLLLCCAGILGGVFAGTISDKVFQSRRGPVSAVLYGIMLLGSIAMVFMLQSPYLGWLMVFMSMAVIGVHGMLSGTASMDFGGKKNVGTAVGIIDGMVYLGAAFQSFIYGSVLPNGDAAAVQSNWISWPVVMVPISLMGFLLAMKIWNAQARSSHGGH
jgi:OPA family glycerol-3-phosphate transporter-like MFS transporter